MHSAPANSDGQDRGSLKSYAAGFVLSLVLTAAAFGLAIQGGGLSRRTVLSGILFAAVVQVLVQLRCFLHLGTAARARLNVLTLVFTLLIILLFVGGTLWIMADLDARMM